MSTNNRIDLVEFPASSSKEVKAVTAFFADVFGWQFKEWGEEYSDTQDSGVAVGVNGSTTKEQTAPLAVIYVEDLEATKDKIVTAGGIITHDVTPFPGGKRFAFTDPAGNQLAAWSDK